MYLVIFVGLFAGLIIYSLTGDNLVSSSTAKKMIKSGRIQKVIDVRTDTEYNMGHYKGSIHIPVYKINKQTTSKLSKTEGILVYCNTGQRARYASEKLMILGFKNVYYISGHYSTLL